MSFASIPSFGLTEHTHTNMHTPLNSLHMPDSRALNTSTALPRWVRKHTHAHTSQKPQGVNSVSVSRCMLTQRDLGEVHPACSADPGGARALGICMCRRRRCTQRLNCSHDCCSAYRPASVTAGGEEALLQLRSFETCGKFKQSSSVPNQPPPPHPRMFRK